MFTNRYIFHGVLGLISIGVIVTQLQTKPVSAYGAGQQSLLYALVTKGQPSFIEETVRPELVVQDSHYLGADTIDTSLGIDFQYEASVANVPLAGTSIPGAIALQPSTNEMQVSGQPPAKKRTKTETYVVQQGDVIGKIAVSFGVNVGTILWANGLSPHSTIRPGQSLKIPPVSGVLHTVKSRETLSSIAKKYQANIDEIREANQLGHDSVLNLGEELVIPGGVPPTVTVPIARTRTRTRTTISAPTPTISKSSHVRRNIPISRIRGKAYDIYQELTGQSDTRTKPSDKTETGTARLLWPTDSHRINQYFGWRHTGIDLHGRYNNAIYAAKDGVVEKAGWNSGGYGLMILINHGGGLKTRYGHSSKLFVHTGQRVKKGDAIAMIGTTGRSTGPHLHFEVIVNGRVQNPLAWIK